MRLTDDYLKELIYYLTEMQKFLHCLSLDKTISPNGPTIRQIIFHSVESADFWMRKVLLEQARPREKEKEFQIQPTKNAIEKSINQALTTAKEVRRSKPDLEKLIDPPIDIGKPYPLISTKFLALLHAATHIAEHFGQLQASYEQTPCD